MLECLIPESMLIISPTAMTVTVPNGPKYRYESEYQLSARKGLLRNGSHYTSANRFRLE